MDDIIGGAEYHESHQMVYGNTTYIEEGMTDYDYDFQVLEYELPEDKKYSKEEMIEIISETLDHFWFHRMDFFKEGLKHTFKQRKIQKQIEQTEKERKDFEKASYEYDAFLKNMELKYGKNFNLGQLTTKELSSFITLHSKWEKEVKRGLKNV